MDEKKKIALLESVVKYYRIKGILQDNLGAKVSFSGLNNRYFVWKDGNHSTAIDISSDNCPLCDLYLGLLECQGCPIYEHTKDSYCHDTPWQNLNESFLFKANHYDCEEKDRIRETRSYVVDDALIKLVQDEIDFLISLIKEIDDE